MESLRKFLFAAMGFDEQSFLERYPHPFLVTSKKTLQSAKTQLSSSDENYKGFSTMLSKGKAEEGLQGDWVIPLQSQSRGEMQMVNLGRTPNNEISLPFPVISKFHCCFMIYGPKDAYIIDGGSTNGTFINDTKLEGSQKQPLKSGDLVRFGTQMEFEFYFPEDLHRELKIIAGALLG